MNSSIYDAGLGKNECVDVLVVETILAWPTRVDPRAMDLDTNGSRYTDTGIGERSTRSLAYLFIGGPTSLAPRILRPMPHTTSALPHVV